MECLLFGLFLAGLAAGPMYLKHCSPEVQNLVICVITSFLLIFSPGIISLIRFLNTGTMQTSPGTLESIMFVILNIIRWTGVLLLGFTIFRFIYSKVHKSKEVVNNKS